LDAGDAVQRTALPVAIADCAEVLTSQQIIGSARERDAEDDDEGQVLCAEIYRIEGVEDKRIVTEARTSINSKATSTC
jgi:hypothetical protein